MSKSLVIPILLIILVGLGVWFFKKQTSLIPKIAINNLQNVSPVNTPQNPLSIDSMRQKNYPGSEIKIEQTLSDGYNYHQYIASYLSDGLKIYGLLTVPNQPVPNGGFPAIIFNHGYIPPDQYKTTERYVAYEDAFARAGYVVFKSDYRGNGNSEGSPEGAYYSPAYTIDVLNALGSIKKMKDVNPNKIGMWGHSMGGNITLRSLVVDPKDIKVAVIWGGVVGTYDDLMNNWHNTSFSPPPSQLTQRNRYRQDLVNQFGTPKTNPAFWNSIDPNSYLGDITAPIQLDYGDSDEEVPPIFSQNLYNNLKKLNKVVEIYSYPGADHNISQDLNLALKRSVEFFDRYLK